MRVLASADVHGAMPVYEWLVEHVVEQRAELLILAGDLFSADWAEGQAKQARNIVGVLKRAPVPVFYIMGNDDNVTLDYADEQIRPLHGLVRIAGKFRFVGYQYTPPFVGHVFVKPEIEIAADSDTLEPLLDSESVFVTHAPAHGFVDSVGGEHVGSRALAALLERKPVLAHIHGHIHESFGRRANHFNVAADARRRAMLIELPSLRHTVLEER